MRNKLFYLAPLSLMAGTALAEKPRPQLPNIIFIFADDMGYGDISGFNPQAKTQTPNIDRMAQRSLCFNSAYSTCGVSTPSRYGLLTGRYFFRTPMRRGVTNGHSPSLIESDRTTIASVLKARGYHTGVVGKWHLGVGWQKRDPHQPLVSAPGYAEYSNVDFTQELSDGPGTVGFDYSFILPASLDMPPYLFIENHRTVDGDQMGFTRDRYEIMKPNTIKGADSSHIKKGDIYWGRGVWWRQGEISSGFKVERCLQEIAAHSLAYIEDQAKSNRPFFLYMPLTSPHTPWMADSAFVGRYNVGDYGAFIAHTDDVVGQICQKVRELGLDEQTLICFSSDNGAPWRLDEIEKWGHNPNEGRRGQKGDIYDGGHHVPFIIQWPGAVEPRQCNTPVSLIDVLATYAELTGYSLNQGEAPDSQSFLPLLRGGDSYERDHIVYQSSDGFLGIRQGDWKLIESLGSGGFSAPRRVEPSFDAPAGQLFNLKNDPLEENNLYTQYPEIVKRLTEKLRVVKQP